MKFSIIEIRQMVSEAIRRAMTEASKKGKKVKITAPYSEELEESEDEKKIKGIPGYSLGDALDYSEPLGVANRTKRQGASSIGNWTSESRVRVTAEDRLRKLIRMVVAEEIRGSRK